MEENVIFKSATFGFDKKEVMNYIASLCEKNAENISKINELQSEIEKCKQENKNLCADNAKLFDDNKALAKCVEESKKTTEALNAKITDLEEKMSKFNEIEGAEEKANLLMMDSLKYSEACIKNARKVSASLNLSTKNKIDKAKSCLNTVSDDFKSLTDRLESSISEISARLEVLSDGLDETNE